MFRVFSIFFLFAAHLHASSEFFSKDISEELSTCGYYAFDDERPFWNEEEREDIVSLFEEILSPGLKCSLKSTGVSQSFLFYFSNDEVENGCFVWGGSRTELPDSLNVLTRRVLHSVGYQDQRCLVELVLVDNFKRKNLEDTSSWAVSWHRDACAGSSHERIVTLNLDLEGVPEHNFLIGVQKKEKSVNESKDSKMNVLACIPVKPGNGYALNEDHKPLIFHASSVVSSFGLGSRKSVIFRFVSENSGHLEKMERFYETMSQIELRKISRSHSYK